jgi:hypothetical protein
MDDDMAPPGHGEIDTFILQALVRRLIAKGLLTTDEVRATLFDAASHLKMFGTPITTATAQDYVEDELVPVFLSVH